MKSIKLSVLDRLMLQQMLPQQGSKIEMLLCDEIVKKVDFSPQEITDLGLKDEDGKVSWERSADKDFEFETAQVEMLKNASRKADENKLVNRQNLQLIEKIDSL